MFAVIYTPTGTEVSRHSTRLDAERALLVVETLTPSHEIQEVAE
jgi:hypothetical protein